MIPIAIDETSETLFGKFANISGSTLIDTLRELEHGGITPLPQNHDQATYCKKIEKEDGLVDWSKSAEEIYHMWQAYTPWPRIYTMYEGKRLLLEKVSCNPPLNGGSSPVSVASRGFLLRHSERSEESMSQKPGSFVPQDDGTIGQVVKLEDGRI
jgi:methionyl-tRNA formyltransferase